MTVVSKCAFCNVVGGVDTVDTLYVDDLVMVFLDLAPVVTGHATLITRQHYPVMNAAPEHVATRMLTVGNDIGVALMRGTDSDGYNLLIAMGRQYAMPPFPSCPEPRRTD